MASILEGLNVLEIGGGGAASSIAGMILADAGARVLKIEPPEGDALRAQNPNGFLIWNRGKESLVADLRTADGKRVFRDFAANADIIVEAFAPGIMRAWGLDPADLCAAHPQLVYCAITGFGADGPYADLKAYDSVIAAKMGLWSRGDFGFRDGPLLMPVPWASFGAATQAVAGIAGALLVRHRTGRGQRIGASLAAGLDPLDYMISTVAQLSAKHSGARSDGATAATRYGVLVVTRDGRFIQTSTILPHQGAALCEVAGIAHVLREKRFARLPAFDAVDDAQDWEDQLLAAFREHDLSYWLPRLEANRDVAFEVACTSEQGLRHPQIEYNGDVIALADPDRGSIEQVGPLGRFSKTPMRPSRAAPSLGRHGGPFKPRVRTERGNVPAPAHPFSGVTIVEFGCFYAMPYALAMMAALGARVIKIEDGKGDPHRASFGKEIASNKTTAGKESISIDLKTRDGQEIAQEIISRADAFVNGFRPDIAERMDLGFERLTERNPWLLYVHAAGYGDSGPYAHRALYAQAAQAVAGSFGRQVGYWSDPSRNIGLSLPELQAMILPRLHQVIDGDSNAALALFAVLALGLYHQQRTGEGQKLNTSMIAGNAWAYADDFCAFPGKRPAEICDEDYYGLNALHRLYPAAADTWLCICVRGSREFERLAYAIGRPGLAATAPAFPLTTHDDALTHALGAAFAEKSAAEWERILSRADVGAAAVSMQGMPAFISFDEGLEKAGLTVRYQHPQFGAMVRAAPPVMFSLGSGRIGPPCLRGEHNRAILSELGYTKAKIDELERRKIVIAAD